MDTPRILLVYPPLDRNILPPLSIATLVACVRGELGGDAAVGFDLNYQCQHVLFRGKERSVLSCCEQSRTASLDHFLHESGWGTSEESLLLPHDHDCMGTITLDDLLANPMGKLIIELMQNQLSERYTLVGVSVCYPSQLLPALLIAHVTKRCVNRPLVVLGGPYVTLHAELLRTLGWLNDVDYLVQGPGDAILPTLAVEAAAIRPRKARVTFIKTALSSRPNHRTPDFTGLELANRGWPRPVVPYLASIGCSWGRCVFCRGLSSDSFIPAHQERLSRDIISLITQYDIGGMCFSDENLDLAAISASFRASTMDSGRPGWVGETRLDKCSRNIDPELVYDAGCRYLMFGLETGSQRLLNLMRKGMSINIAEDVIRRYSDAGILLHLFLMVGFPTESKEDIACTMKFLERNEQWIASLSVSCFRPWPGTVVWQDPTRYGIAFDKTPARDMLENRYRYISKLGVGADLAKNRADEVLDHPVVRRLTSKLLIASRACASLGTKCGVVALMNQRLPQMPNRGGTHV